MRVRLMYAPLPWIGALAVHYWFVAEGHRWEVWQTANAGGTCFGHVHRDLKGPEEGVGGGPARLAAEWDGEEAAAIMRVLEEPRLYPYCDNYHYWPGPNSNTYVAWVLRRAGVLHALNWRAFGARFR